MKRLSSPRGKKTDSGGEQGFWPSYADMMSSFALILFFLMLLSYIQNLVTGNDLQNTQEVLTNTKAELSLTQTEMENAEAQLFQIQTDLEDATKQLTGKQEEVVAQQALIDRQEEFLAAANEELDEMRSQMQTIAVLRLSILEQIKDSIVDVMGDSSKVSIGENGNIILNEGVFFDTGSYDIKSDSADVLKQLSQVFSSFLSNPKNSVYIDSIVISGHTDSDGFDDDNRILSTNRANAVLDYLLGHGGLDSYSSYFCAAGYGETRPVASNMTEEGKAKNRRIEISIILKDDTVLDIVDKYLEKTDDNPGSTASSSSKPSSSTSMVSPSPSPSPTPGSSPWKKWRS